MLLPIFTILATQNHILSSSLLQFHHNLSPSLHSSHFHSIIHTKPHTFSSLLQFHHNLSAFFYSNSHYTLFPYVLLSNHPLISHYCTYCLHRYYYKHHLKKKSFTSCQKRGLGEYLQPIPLIALHPHRLFCIYKSIHLPISLLQIRNSRVNFYH